MPPSQPSCSEQSDYQRAVGRVVSPLTRRFGAAALGHPGSRWERGAPSGLPCASAQWPFQRLAASSPRKEGGYLGFLCVWGGTPPTSLHEEGASFQACAAMPQIPKPACFRCTVPVTLWMEPFRPLVTALLSLYQTIKALRPESVKFLKSSTHCLLSLNQSEQ